MPVKRNGREKIVLWLSELSSYGTFGGGQMRFASLALFLVCAWLPIFGAAQDSAGVASAHNSFANTTLHIIIAWQ